MSNAVALAQENVAPAISLQDTRGQLHTIAHFAGKPGIVHFWATWCSSCVLELPQLIDAANEMRAQGLSFTLIAADSHTATRAYLQAQNLDIDVLVDQYGKAMREYQIQALPTSVFINTRGQIIETRRGQIDWDSPVIRQKLAILLGNK